MVDETVKIYGRIDVLIYNSGAIWWASVENTPIKRFQLMQRVNPEGKSNFTITQCFIEKNGLYILLGIVLL